MRENVVVHCGALLEFARTRLVLGQFRRSIRVNLLMAYTLVAATHLESMLALAERGNADATFLRWYGPQLKPASADYGSIAALPMSSLIGS